MANLLSGTPFHPQWLLGGRYIPAGLSSLNGYVLDIGSADSWIAKHLPESAEYVSLDTPKTGAELYGARPVVFADGMRLPFRDASIDNVICLEVAEHVDDSRRLVAEISRVLKPGGALFFTMPFLYPIHDAPYDFQRYTKYGLENLMQTAGLEVVSVERKTNAIKTAGGLVCLSIAGSLEKSSGIAILLLPIALILVLTVNLSAALLSLIWPDWQAMTFGYSLRAVKPQSHE
jgi:SAM-dependent methyltransferase